MKNPARGVLHLWKYTTEHPAQNKQCLLSEQTWSVFPEFPFKQATFRQRFAPISAAQRPLPALENTGDRTRCPRSLGEKQQEGTAPTPVSAGGTWGHQDLKGGSAVKAGQAHCSGKPVEQLKLAMRSSNFSPCLPLAQEFQSGTRTKHT